MSDLLPERLDPHLPLFGISVAARLADMHPQTLRGYDRLGLVVPRRARGRGRRYSLHDVSKLRHIQDLSQREGINLEGIRRILALENELETLRSQLDRISDILASLQAAAPGRRLFTAEAGGAVHLGRTRTVPSVRQLPSA